MPTMLARKAGEEEVAAEAEDERRQRAGKPHAGALEQPGGDEDDQRQAVVAADLHPVLAGGEQEAAENRPAEAEEHLVRVPLAGRERGRGRAARAAARSCRRASAPRRPAG